MKLMLNGAVTLGTMDGANVEIYDAVGEDNIFIFGMTTPEVEQLKRNGYNPMQYMNNNAVLKNAVDFIAQGVNSKQFGEITSSLMNIDPYMALADFADYQKAQQIASNAYQDKERFAKMSLMNISGAGIFSADRSIMDYANTIWNTRPVVFPKEKAKTAKKTTKKEKAVNKAEEPKKSQKKETVKTAKKETPKTEKKAPAKKESAKEENKAPAKKKADKTAKKSK